MKQALLVGAICALPFLLCAHPSDPVVTEKIASLIQNGEIEKGVSLAKARGYIVIDDIIVIHIVDPATQEDVLVCDLRPDRGVRPED